MVPLQWLEIVFFIVALCGSFFYAFKATDIFGLSTEGKHWAWKVHQFWFNLSGSILGWAALWFVVRKIWIGPSISCSVQLSWSDAVIIAVSFAGTTGHLPYAASGLLSGLNELAAKLAGQGK